MSAKAELFFILLLLVSVGTKKIAAESFASAQIRTTATVVMPFGFIGNSPTVSEEETDTIDFARIDICYPPNSGIIVNVCDYNGTIKRYRFSGDSEGNNPGNNEKVNCNTISMGRNIRLCNDILFQDSCLITLITSEN